jgi:hypothetical protein
MRVPGLAVIRDAANRLPTPDKRPMAIKHFPKFLETFFVVVSTGLESSLQLITGLVGTKGRVPAAEVAVMTKSPFFRCKLYPKMELKESKKKPSPVTRRGFLLKAQQLITVERLLLVPALPQELELLLALSLQ